MLVGIIGLGIRRSSSTRCGRVDQNMTTRDAPLKDERWLQMFSPSPMLNRVSSSAVMPAPFRHLVRGTQVPVDVDGRWSGMLVGRHSTDEKTNISYADTEIIPAAPKMLPDLSGVSRRSNTDSDRMLSSTQTGK